MTSAADRLASLDILRGVSLLGILYAHIVIWFAGATLPREIYQQFTDTGSLIAFAVFGTFVLGKFFAIFSFLFGISFFIQEQSFLKKNENVVTRFSLRLTFLLIIGFIHHALWRGDILMIFALLGFVLLLLRNLNENVILFLGLLFVFNIPLLLYDLVSSSSEIELPMEDEAWPYYHLLSKGSLMEHISANISILMSKFEFQWESGRLIKTLGFFCLGYYVGKKKIFSSTQGTLLLKRAFTYSSKVFVLMCILGGVLMFFEVITFEPLEQRFESTLPLPFLYNLFNAVLTILYISGIVTWLHNPRVAAFLNVFGYAGRMALTVYMTQSIIGIALFYGIGLGLLHNTTPAVNALITIPFFALQLLFCKLWLQRFKQGPIEALWRRITFLDIGVERNKNVSYTATQSKN